MLFSVTHVRHGCTLNALDCQNHSSMTKGEYNDHGFASTVIVKYFHFIHSIKKIFSTFVAAFSYVPIFNDTDIEKSFKKFYGRYQDLIEKYQMSVNVMVNDSFPG